MTFVNNLLDFFKICLFVHDIFSPYFFSVRIFFLYKPNPPPPQKFNGLSLKSSGLIAIVDSIGLPSLKNVFEQLSKVLKKRLQ